MCLDEAFDDAPRKENSMEDDDEKEEEDEEEEEEENEESDDAIFDGLRNSDTDTSESDFEKGKFDYNCCFIYSLSSLGHVTF